MAKSFINYHNKYEQKINCCPTFIVHSDKKNSFCCQSFQPVVMDPSRRERAHRWTGLRTSAEGTSSVSRTTRAHVPKQNMICVRDCVFGVERTKNIQIKQHVRIDRAAALTDIVNHAHAFTIADETRACCVNVCEYRVLDLTTHTYMTHVGWSFEAHYARDKIAISRAHNFRTFSVGTDSIL